MKKVLSDEAINEIITDLTASFAIEDMIIPQDEINHTKKFLKGETTFEQERKRILSKYGS